MSTGATQRPSQEQADPRRRLATALGVGAAVALVLSLAFPYWQARLFAPQYRNGLTATMYAFKVSGDISEIDELNHYIGMRKLGDLAVVERLAAIPAVLFLAFFCAYAALRGGRRLRGWAAAAAAAYPVGFLADMAFWMRWSTSHLDPMAPLKLRPFSIPPIGVGRVAQFRSEMWPQSGFFLALAATVVLIAVWRVSRRLEPGPAGGCAHRPENSAKPALVVALMACLAPSARAAALQPLIDAAEPGSTLELAPGRYEGPATIAKPLAIRGGRGAVVSGDGKGTVVTIRSEGVTLEDLSIAASGDSLLFEDAGVRVEAPGAAIRRCRFDDVLFGVFLVHAPGALIEDSQFNGKPLDMGRRGDLIRSWNSDRVVVRRSTFEGGRDFVLWFSTGSRVEDNVVRNGRYGLHFMYTNDAVVEGNRFLGNSVGFYVMYSQRVQIRKNRFERHRGPSGAGLGLKESDWLDIEDNDFVGNRQAVYIDGSPLVADRTNVYARNVLARNDIGMSILPGVAGNVFTDNAFEDNLQQISVRGGGRLTGNDWDRAGRGNYWSDYAGYGPTGAQIGVIPYRVESAWEDLMDRRPAARFFMFTPAAQAVDLAGRAFPIFTPKTVLSDIHPLLRAPADCRRTDEPIQAAWGLPLGLASLAGLLLGFPGLVRRRASVSRTSRVLACGPALSVSALSKGFNGHLVLSGVSAEVGSGETLLLWGPNGSGKSTLLKCALGLYHDYDGCIRIFGFDARTQGERARSLLGSVAQEFAGYDWTVRRAMQFVSSLRVVPEAAIDPALERCGLREHANKRVCDLSGGMKQKLSLAQALLADPPLLLLDEPCSSLDAASRKDLLRILFKLKGSRAIVMTSHRLEEVEALADKVLWLEEGGASRLLPVADFCRAASARPSLRQELEASS